MAYDGWLEYNGIEVVNLSRTAQLAQAMGIDTVRTTPQSVAWIQTVLGGTLYNDITTAPWYDSGYPASTEFAGIVPLSFPGLDDSTMESTPVEYITDGGHSGKPRNATLPIVASVAIIASTDRGANFGKRWLDRVFRSGGDSRVFCSGADLRYFQWAAEDAPIAHRRDVRQTRGTSVTRKRRNDCSATWLATFTLTAADPFEYSDEFLVLQNLGGPIPAGEMAPLNPLAIEPPPLSDVEYMARSGWPRTWLTGVGSHPFGITTAARITAPIPTSSNGRGFDMYGGVGGGLNYATQFVAPGDVVTMSAWVRSNRAETWLAVARFVDATGIPLAANIGGTPLGLLANNWGNVSVQTPPAPFGAAYVVFSVWNANVINWIAGDTIDMTGLAMSRVPTPVSPVLSYGSAALVETTCPEYDYDPIYDPLYPALVAPPVAPDFFPSGWDIVDGMTFDRFWAEVTPIEPTALDVVPVITLNTPVEARMIRVGIWEGGTDPTDQCGDLLFGVVVTYLPAGVDFVIDGEQRASYVWDNVSPSVRRCDSLVYSFDAKPVDWTKFNDPTSLLVTLDVFSDSSGIEGDGEVRAALSLVQKSD